MDTTGWRRLFSSCPESRNSRLDLSEDLGSREHMRGPKSSVQDRRMSGGGCAHFCCSPSLEDPGYGAPPHALIYGRGWRQSPGPATRPQEFLQPWRCAAGDGGESSPSHTQGLFVGTGSVGTGMPSDRGICFLPSPASFLRVPFPCHHMGAPQSVLKQSCL